MGQEEDNELTLEGLAQKLETQAQRLESLERENAELRDEVSTLRSSGTRRDEVLALRGSDEHRDQEEPVSEFEGQVSRRALLSKAGAAAVAAMAAGTLLNPREAKALHFGDDITSNYITTHKLKALADNQISFNPIEGRNT